MKLFGDGFREECGVCAVVGHPDAANLVYLGLYALQHRGQESAGIAVWDGQGIYAHRAMGYVADIFDRDILSRLSGAIAIGHVRYSTAGDSTLANAQPLLVNTHFGPLAIAHNGNLVNAPRLRKELEEQGAIFQSSSDTEVIFHLVARGQGVSVADAIVAALGIVQGAFSLVMLAKDQVIVARDPLGFRPLVLGKVDGAWVVASETCAFDLLGATVLREVEPGEVLLLSPQGWQQLKPASPPPYAHCIFEHVYFARPDSRVFGEDVGMVRQRMGERLALEQPANADVVVGVPDSGIPAALGYARVSGLPFVIGMVRNHYVGRTFIEPKQSIRHFGVKVKLNPVRSAVAGKRVVLVDDSIVRGTTSRKIVIMLKQAGAREVHLRISSPPTIGSCFYGIDTPERRELIAANATIEEIRAFVGAESLGYLSVDGMLTCLQSPHRNFCTACFSGRYPIVPGEEPALARAER